MIHLASIFPNGLAPDIFLSSSLLATAPNSETAPMVLAAVLLSLVFIYLASKLGGELSKFIMIIFDSVKGLLRAISC